MWALRASSCVAPRQRGELASANVDDGAPRSAAAEPDHCKRPGSAAALNARDSGLPYTVIGGPNHPVLSPAITIRVRAAEGVPSEGAPHMRTTQLAAHN